MKSLYNYLTESYDNKVTYVNAIVVTADKQYVLILHRSDINDKFKRLWCFPGGNKETTDFTSKDALLRELKEETGIILSWDEESRTKLIDTVKHNSNEKSEYWLIILDSTTPVDVKLSNEHTNFEWYSLDSVKQHKWMPGVYSEIQLVLDRFTDDPFWKVHKYFDKDEKGFEEFVSWVDNFKKSKYVNVNELKRLIDKTDIDIKSLIDFINDTISNDPSVSIDYVYQVKKLLEQIINYQN